MVGLVNGLYATSSGIGGITLIEAFKNYSNTHLELELTGQQGDVMKESMRVAKTIAWNLLPSNFKKNIIEGTKFGIHIHCPSAATPKDGPSAGAAITIAIISLLTGFTVKHTYGITGEIDLNGNVLEIGGLTSKLEGAKTAGINTVLCPKQNEDDLNKILEKNPKLENSNFKVILIETIYQAMDYMLNINTSIVDKDNFFNKLQFIKK